MIASVLLTVLLAAPQVRLAPDQPLPYVFSDEPVIVEFRGETDLDFDVMIVYGTGQFPSNSHGLGPIALQAGRPYWTTTNLEPVRFGVHAITLNLQWPTGSQKYEFTLQRIRRPNVVNPAPLMVRIPNRTGPWEQICRVLPATQVSIDSTHPELERLLDTFKREGIAVRLNIVDDEPVLPAESAPASIAIPASGSVDSWARRVRQTRSRFPATRVVLLNPTPDFLLALLRSGAAPLFNAVSVESTGALLANRAAAEHQGYENLAYSVSIAAATNMQVVAEAWNAGAYVAEVSLDSVWYDEALTPEFGALNAAIHLCDQTRVAGRFSDDYEQVIVLRHIEPSRTGQWLAPVGTAGGLPGAEWYADEHGNAHVQPPADVAYAVGTDPDIALRAIALEIRREAGVLREGTEVFDALSDEFGKAVDRLMGCDGSQSMRAEFFSLLRALPPLEQAWHDGLVRKSQAVPATASIERLIRRLAALEQTIGIPFVEPLEETLDRCAEQQALYLTATVGPGASAERGERLMMHISRLIEEARAYHRQGRVIEGDAIAALAEWRARALVHTAKARPLSEVEPERQRD